MAPTRTGQSSTAQLSVARWVAQRLGGLTCRCLLRNKFFLLALAVFGMTLVLLRSSIVDVADEAGDGFPVWRERGMDARVTPISQDIHGVRNESKIKIVITSAPVNDSQSKPTQRPTKPQPKSAPSPPKKAAVYDRRKPNFTEEINYFANIYNNSLPDGDKFFEYAARVIKRAWKPNPKNTETFRKDIRAALGEVGRSQNVYLTKDNTPEGSTMIYYMAGKPSKIANHIWSMLPDNSVFQPNRFKVCSVIGSSGILKGSRCGAEIDKSDFVFRFNLAPVRGFEVDVGRKTNFTTLNPTFIMKKVNSIKTKEDEAKMIDELRQFQESYMYLPGFAVSGSLRLLVKIAGVAMRANVTKPVYGSPDHFLVVANLWRKTLDTELKWPSTGLYAVSSLFDACDRIHVYGFWPFPKSVGGKAVPYHYNNNVKPTKVHNFDKEFKTLLMLHEKGIINLHLQSCK
ncbi:CMP-N-acetylneuraminate-poly-alpha-2,8-sialyltransferase-like [Patiria miniata]|uniref:Uncharacterized protein n=1 Tax=Patiria miniata TaxID=46514 RepID=A0A914BNS4_PATMI|nr:CMP-N-acetylneuraminate-poly-alpha-2,8-sialyltransferase-like [Patiria miniata]